jgi:hypothetical protein
MMRLMEQEKHTERRVALTMSSQELQALDAYCAKGRRETGSPFARAEVIRSMIAKSIVRIPPKELKP